MGPGYLLEDPRGRAWPPPKEPSPGRWGGVGGRRGDDEHVIGRTRGLVCFMLDWAGTLLSQWSGILCALRRWHGFRGSGEFALTQRVMTRCVGAVSTRCV